MGAGRSREALLEAIAQRQHSQFTGTRDHKHVAGDNGSDRYGADLSAESTEVARRRKAFKQAESLLKQAEAELDEKREWYRFVQNHTKNAAEFHEMCQSETPQSYRRLLGVATADVSLLSGTKPKANDDALLSTS